MERDERARALLAAGDTGAAATELIRCHGPAVLGYLRSLLRDEDLAADAFSLFAEWVWESITRFRGESTLRTWALGVAWNAAQRVRNEAWQRRRARFRTGEASRLAADIRSQSVLRHEREADALEQLRYDLSAEEQNLLVLRLEQRLEWNEIAAVLASEGDSASAATLRKRFERLKERIAQLARDRGLLG